MPLSPANLTPLSQRLAKNNRRVAAVLDRLPTIAGQVVAAFLRRDQRALQELSQHLAASAAGEGEIGRIALELQTHVHAREQLPLQRSLLDLIGELGGLRRRGMVPAAALPTASE